MLEINNLEITKETFEDLNVSLKKSIMEAEEGKAIMERALYRIKSIQENIENNLAMHKEKNNE